MPSPNALKGEIHRIQKGWRSTKSTLRRIGTPAFMILPPGATSLGRPRKLHGWKHARSPRSYLSASFARVPIQLSHALKRLAILLTS
jgi:hypothetical protein